jgi:hypothetical protein
MHPQGTFRGLFPTEEIVQEVWRRADALRACDPEIRGCHVCIERMGARKPACGYRVVVQLSAAHAESVIEHSSEEITCRDVSAGLAQAFSAARVACKLRLPQVASG